LYSRDHPLAAIARWRPLRWLGSIAYGAYLFHQPIQGLVFALIRRGEPRIVDLFSLILSLVSLALTLGLAHLSWNLLKRAWSGLATARAMNSCPRNEASCPLPFPQVLDNERSSHSQRSIREALSARHRSIERPPARFSRPCSQVASAFPGAPKQESFWALKDVSLEVREGEVLGLIGRNGAGKTTLLKILSRITQPTTGWAEIHGRVGSLLEVGTGFHSELTGRENTFLSGAILGMSKREIASKFDEIVAFAELEKFIDTLSSTTPAACMSVSPSPSPLTSIRKFFSWMKFWRWVTSSFRKMSRENGGCRPRRQNRPPCHASNESDSPAVPSCRLD